MLDSGWDNLRITLLGALGSANLAAMSPSKRRALYVVRVFHTVGRDLADGQLTLRAMGLVYTTLLSIVPLLAVSFSVLKAFGVHNQLEGTLLNVLAPLGEQGIRITDQIVGFVENIKVGALGSLGLALLIWTVVSLMQKIESAVNHTWRIRRTRGMLDRFSRYLSVVMVGPVLVFSAMGISASLMRSETVQQIMAVEPFGALFSFVAGLVPYVLLTAAFTFVYAYIPNTRVKLAAAIAGGFIAALLWAGASWGFAAFIVSSTSKWTAVYSSLAILMLFMVWLYVGWTILLVGAAVAFYAQNPHSLYVSNAVQVLSNRRAEQVGLRVMQQVARRFVVGGQPYSSSELSSELRVPLEPLREVVKRLVRKELLMTTGSDRDRYVPARDLQSIQVLDIWQALRSSDDDIPAPGSTGSDTQVDGLLARLDEAVRSVSGEATLRQLADESPVTDQVTPARRVRQTQS